MAKDPTIPFYAQDFYIDTLQWSEEEVGAYTRLLCTLWINGFCYNSAIELANVSPLAKHVVDKYSDKFVFYDDNKFSSKRLEEERAKRIKNRELRSSAGKKGAESRWQTHSKDDSKKITNVNEKENGKEKEIINIEFDEFWNLYDYKKNKPECEKLWNGIKKTKQGHIINDETRSLIIKRLPVYVKNTYKNGDYPGRQHPHTYLFGECWNDEIVENSNIPKSKKKIIGSLYKCPCCDYEKIYKDEGSYECPKYPNKCEGYADVNIKGFDINIDGSRPPKMEFQNVVREK